MDHFSLHNTSQDLESSAKFELAKSHAQKFKERLKDFEIASYQAPSSHQAYVNLGKVSQLQGEHLKALQHFNSAIQLRPTAANLYTLRAVSYAAMDKYNEAFEDFSASLKLDERYFPAYLERARLYFELDQKPTAKSDLEFLITHGGGEEDLLKAGQDLLEKIEETEVDPILQGRIDRLLEGALASYNKQVYRAAVALYTELLELDPRNKVALANRGQAYAKMQDYRSALIDTEQVLELDPDVATLILNKGYILLKMGERKKALPILNKAIAKDPNLYEAYAYRAECVAENDRDKAFADLDLSIEMIPDFWEAYLLRGQLHLDDESWMSAAQDFCLAIEYNPEAYDAFDGLDQIDEHYRWAISRNPEDIYAYIRRAHYLNLVGRHEDALSIWDKALTLNPGNPMLLHGRAMIRRELEQLQYALIDMNRVLDLDSSHPIYFKDRAIILGELCRPREALVDLEHAIGMDPQKPEFYFLKGRILRMMAEYPGSLHALKIALRLGKEDAEIHQELALCYLALQQVQQAAAHYKKAVQENPEPELIYDYASVLMWLGKYKDAIPYLDAVLEEVPEHWEALMERAEAYGKSYHFEEALADIDQLTVLIPNHAEVWLKRAEIYAIMKDWSSVEKACEEALAKDYRLTAAQELLEKAQLNITEN